jgi:hypothetical protein
MKTLKSIQKNQAQLNSLLMEKWNYGKKDESIEEAEVVQEEEEVEDLHLQKHNEDKLDEQEDTMVDIMEDHNCRSAHPGVNHDQWIGKHR